MWEELLTNSPQGTRYASPAVINALGCEVDNWLVLNKNQIVAGVPVITSNRASHGLPMHSYYIGLMYHKDIYKGKENRKTECEIAISEFVMDELSKVYDCVEFSLHHSISDVRGFDWFNYHSPENGRAKISPQYTAISNLQPLSDIRAQARSSRRREEGYAKTREGLHFFMNGTAEELVELYRQTFVRQSLEVSESELQVTMQFASYLLSQQLGEIAVVRDGAGAAQAAGLLFYDLSGFVHIPVVGTLETKYGGTLLYFQMMEYAANKGFEYMDFNGANSPSRGYFKHSVGAKAQLFFHVSWQKPVNSN